MIIVWIITIACILLYIGIGSYASVVLGYNSTTALYDAPKFIRECVTLACTCGFLGIFVGAPISIISTIIYFSQRKTPK